MSQIIRLLDNRAVICFLIFLSFFYFLIGFNQGLIVYDEGLVVYGAARVLDGEVPYRDFWTLYAPAQFYVLAGLFRVFGASLIVERIWGTIVVFVLSATVYLLARKVLPRKPALIAWFLTATAIGSYRLFAKTMPSALLFSLVSCLCLLNFMSQRHETWLILAGLAAAIAVLFGHDIGFYTLVSELLVMPLFMYANLTPKERGTPSTFVRAARVAGRYYFLGIAIVLAPALFYFVRIVPLDDLIYDLVIFPITIYPKVRSLPYPAPIPSITGILAGELSITSFAKSTFSRAPFYFPLLVYVISTILLVVRIRKQQVRWDQVQPWSVILLVLLGALFLNYVRVRSDTLHLVPTSIPAIMLFCVTSYDVSTTTRNARFTYWLLVAFMVVIAASILITAIFYGKTRIVIDSYLSSPALSLSLDRAKGVYVEHSAMVYQEAIQYIQQNVPEDERIFVGNSRHDRIVTNDVMFYFLADRHSATEYHELHPGVATTTAIQQKIINGIEMQRVRYIVLRNENGESRERSGISILDDFIRDQFTMVRQFGEYSVWSRSNQGIAPHPQVAAM